MTQNKKRVFEKDKCEYTFRTINSIINSIKKNIKELKKIKIRIFIIDYNSKKDDLKVIINKLNNSKIEYEIINLDLEKFDDVKTINKNNPSIEKNMKATMASINSSFNLAKEKSDDLVYFVEDDYIHKSDSIFEMISAMRRFH